MLTTVLVVVLSVCVSICLLPRFRISLIFTFFSAVAIIIINYAAFYQNLLAFRLGWLLTDVYHGCK